MADILTLINSLPESLQPNPEREWKIAHPGKVARPVAEVVVGLLTGIATATVVVRIVIHLRYRGRLFIDDYVVAIATVCLIIETALVYHNLDMIYLETSLATDPMNIVLFTRSEVLELVDTFLKWTNIWQTFAWTANYLIKLSFLAFFRLLVRGVSRRLNWYWWFVLCFTIASWIFNSIENFILCGASNSLKCFPYPRYNEEMGWSSTATDVITDLMTFSIPVLLLRNAQLRLAQKVRILTFLCLSIVMTAFAIARLAGELMRDSSGVLTYSLVWATLFLHIECSVAVIMGGITAFRTMFTRQIHDREAQLETASSSTPMQYIRRLLRKNKSLEDLNVMGKPQATGAVLEAPKTTATLKGLRTFIGRNKWQSGHTTMEESLDGCDYNPEASYHNFIRHEERNRGPTEEPLSHNRSMAEEYKRPERPLPVLQTHNTL